MYGFLPVEAMANGHKGERGEGEKRSQCDLEKSFDWKKHIESHFQKMLFGKRIVFGFDF